MADPRDLNEFGGQRLYRNSLDDILDQVQRDIENERSIANARQNTIINSEDPVQKLKEVQTIEKSVAQETPEIQQTVLNRTYNIPQQPAPTGFLQPNPNPQYTVGQPRGEQQNLSDDDIRLRVELERIQGPFDELYQEKLKTAKEIPGRKVMDPISGGSYTVPGSTKEEIARRQTIQELEKQKILNPGIGRDIGAFLTQAIPLGGLTPREQAEQSFYPVRNALAQLPGVFAGLGATSKLIKAPTIAKKSFDAVRKGTKIGNFLTKQGINTVKAGKFTASATTGAGTFGAYRVIDQIDENVPVEDKAKAIVEDAIFGAGFGLTGSLNNPATRSLAEGTFGFVSSKLIDGATTQEALLNGILFAGFGILNKKNMKDVERGIAINEFKGVGDDALSIIKDLRKQSNLKPLTRLQEKQWKKAVNNYADELIGAGVPANKIQQQTDEFISRFLRSNDPKGSVAKIRQIGNQSKTQMLQGKAKIKKEAVSVPTTGKADKVSQENVLRLSTGEQLRRIKDLGFTEEQFVRLSGKQRQDILDNSIKEENFVTEQPTRPSMPVPGPAPDVTPSTKKSDKLVPEKLEPKPEKVKPEVKLTKGEATGLKTTTLKPTDIKIDESKFQPREEYNQAVIDSIAKNFKAEKWEEPVVWQDPKNNDYYIVDGHHRQRGVVKGGYESATYKVLPKGTTLDQAINISEEGNLGRTPQKDFENGKVVRRRFNKGDSLVSIADALPGLTKAQSNAGKSNAVRKLLNLSYLDNKGKLKSNYDNVNEFPRIQSTSSYIGALRKQYDWIPDRYEDDLFTYLYTENGIRQDDADWKLNLESTLEKLADAKERPGSILKQLRQDPLQPKEGTPDEVLTQIKDLKKSIENAGRNLSDDKFLQGEIARIQEEKGLSEIDALQEAKRDLRKRRAELKTELKELVDDSSKPDPNQSALFAPLEQFNIFKGTDIITGISKENRIKLDDLVNELSQVNRESYLLSKQILNNQVSRLKAEKLNKELQNRNKELQKQISKIDKPIKGSTFSPGIPGDFNKQFELNLNKSNKYRKNATKKQKETVKEIRSEISGVGERGRLSSVRDSFIKTQIKKVGASHFIGQKIKSVKDLAGIAQVARDPRFETLRYYFVNDKNKIVGYTAVSNKMPGWVNPYLVPGAKRNIPYKDQGVDGIQELAWWINSLLEKNKATKFYIQHNHPSASSKPSGGDVIFTGKIAEIFKEKFAGHIVIDFDEYSVIKTKKNPTLQGGVYEYDPLEILDIETVKMPGLSPQKIKGKDPLRKTDIKNRFNYYSDSIKTLEDLVVHAKMIQQNNTTTFVPLTMNMQVNGIVDIPTNIILEAGRNKSKMIRLKAEIRKIAKDYGAQRLWAYSDLQNMDTPVGKRINEYSTLEKVLKELRDGKFINDAIRKHNDALIETTYSQTTDLRGHLYFGEKPKGSPSKIVGEKADYRGVHTAPKSKFGAPGHDITGNGQIYPGDVYSNNGARYYGHGGLEKGLDEETIKILNTFRGKPNKLVTIYRAVPKNVKEINPGDWVTVNKKYAEFHGKGWLDNSFTVLSKKVPAKEIFTDGNSIHEFGWNPQTNAPPSQAKSPEFKKWFKKSKAVDENGKPEILYHGTTQNFDVFDIKNAIPDADLGKGFYFTNNIVDVNKNYGNIKGADLRNKIERIAERNELYGEDQRGDDRIVAEIEKDLAPNEGNVMPVYLSLQNPVDLGAKGTFIEPAYTYDEKLDEYIDDEESIAVKILDAIGFADNVEFKELQKIQSAVGELIGDGIYAKDLIDGMKKIDEITYMEDDNGELVGNEFISDLFAEAGFDGFIVPDANKRFNMDMVEGTTHYIVFNPTQIKSAIGNRGTFDPNSPSIIEDNIPAFKIKPHKQSQKESSKVPQKIYDNVKTKSVMDIARERTKELKGPGLISKALTPLSTRLRVIAPELKRAIRRFQANVDINTAKDLKVAENFMKQTNKLRKKNKKDYAVLDLAMKNSDINKVKEVLEKHTMGSEFIKVRNLLDNLYARAEMVGYEPNYLSDYFPRKIKDSDGLMGYLEASDSWGVLQSNIKAKEKELGRRLEKDERLKLINNLIRGFGGRLGIQRPSNLKEREIEYLDNELNEFYFDSNTALHKYIVQMNEAIEIKRFFGKGMGPEDPNIQVDNNVVGEYVDDLVSKGAIKSTQQDELINLLRIRFAQGPMDPRLAKMRSRSYLFTMGQLSSAVTQIGDLAWSIYSGSLTETGKALGRSAVGKSKITREDIGIEKIAQEFTEVDSASKILDTVFTLTGLKYIDALGKESLINSTLSEYQKQAKKGKFSSSLQDRLNEAFDKKELPKVIEDLKSGNITDDIKYLAHYTLSDFQPVSLTEMPEFYLKAPNGRIMYMLKSYTLKQFDVIRNEAFKKMNEGKTVKEKAEGVKRLIYLTSVLMLTGMSADKIKNYMYSREQDFDELVGDNLLKLFGLQKYLIWVQRRYKNLGWTAVKALIPPVGVFNPVFEAFVRDLYKVEKSINKNERLEIPGDLESVKNIPIFGRFYYNYFGNGKKFHAKRKEKEKKKKRKRKYKRPPL